MAKSPANRRRAPDVFEEVIRLRERGQPAALCTVLIAQGSTPGKETMRMLVREDGTILGSVGGGCVEAEVIEMALEVIAADRPESRSFTLNRKDLPESGLICGGQVTILAEPVVPPVLVLFGGGHVAEAICRVACECELRIEVCDDRAEYADPERHALADACHCGPWAEMATQFAPALHHDLVVATRGHRDDFEILLALARADCRPRSLGLLGSRAKRATLDRMLADEGVSEEFRARIETPIGLPIGSRTAGEIAVSVVAGLIRRRRLGGNGDPASV